MITVTGYDEGVAYTVQIDSDEQPLAGAGVVTHASPRRVLRWVDANDGEQYPLTATGTTQEVSLTNPLGIVAALAAHTDIVTLTGDELPQPEPGVDH